MNYAEVVAKFPQFTSDDLIRQSQITSLATACEIEVNAVEWNPAQLKALALDSLLLCRLINAPVFGSIGSQAPGAGNPDLSLQKLLEQGTVSGVDISEEVSVRFSTDTLKLKAQQQQLENKYYCDLYKQLLQQSNTNNTNSHTSDGFGCFYIGL